MPPALSLIIVDYLSRPEIDSALRSIGRFEPEAEVIVSSNSPYDERQKTELVSAFPGVRFSWNDANLGYAGGVNRGLAIATGRVVGILNPDVELVGSVGAELGRAFQQVPEVGLIGPRVLDESGRTSSSCRRFFSPVYVMAKFTPFGALPTAKRLIGHVLMSDFDRSSFRLVDWISGGAMFGRADAIAQVGGMDERYFLYMEDVDWCRRFWEVGWSVAYVPNVAVMHRAKHAGTRRGVRGLFSQPTRRMLASYWKYLVKNGIRTRLASREDSR